MNYNEYGVLVERDRYKEMVVAEDNYKRLLAEIKTRAKSYSGFDYKELQFIVKLLCGEESEEG